MMNNGFILVASNNYKYLLSAKFCAETLKDYFPEAKVSLYTIPQWDSEDLYDVFDSVDATAPEHIRAKLWALSKTPYDITVYLDADCEIVSSDIKYIFDEMEDDADIMITKIRPYNGKISKFPGGELTDHGGMFMYNNKPHTIEFMRQWWELYKKQKTREWQWDTNLYPEELRPWDQWSYWWLQNKTEYAIKRKYFKDDARWNFVNGYKKSETDKEIVVYHHTIKKG